MTRSMNKLQTACIAVLLATTVTLLSAESSAVAQTTPPAASASATLSELTVKALQEALNRQGIAVKVDGVLSEETRAAIRKYQTQHHLPVTGEADKPTLDKLGVAARESAGPAQPQTLGQAIPMVPPAASAPAQAPSTPQRPMQPAQPPGGMTSGPMMQGQMQAMMQMMQGMTQMMHGQMRPGQAQPGRMQSRPMPQGPMAGGMMMDCPMMPGMPAAAQDTTSGTAQGMMQMMQGMMHMMQMMQGQMESSQMQPGQMQRPQNP